METGVERKFLAAEVNIISLILYSQKPVFKIEILFQNIFMLFSTVSKNIRNTSNGLFNCCSGNFLVINHLSSVFEKHKMDITSQFIIKASKLMIPLFNFLIIQKQPPGGVL